MDELIRLLNEARKAWDRDQVEFWDGGELSLYDQVQYYEGDADRLKGILDAAEKAGLIKRGEG